MNTSICSFVSQIKLIGGYLHIANHNTVIKARVRRIVEGKDHQLDCKVDGTGEMMVTARFVKKS